MEIETQDWCEIGPKFFKKVIWLWPEGVGIAPGAASEAGLIWDHAGLMGDQLRLIWGQVLIHAKVVETLVDVVHFGVFFGKVWGLKSKTKVSKVVRTIVFVSNIDFVERFDRFLSST